MTENDLPILIPPSQRSDDWDPSGPVPFELDQFEELVFETKEDQ